MKRTYFEILILIFLSLLVSCGKTKIAEQQRDISNKQYEQNLNIKVTFIELGSVNCIPCRQMQPIMKSIEEKYNGLVKVVFHDVWKDKKPAQQYGIKLIPTQVFLDENGKEFFRHEGFFPEEEIDKLLGSKGLSPGN